VTYLDRFFWPENFMVQILKKKQKTWKHFSEKNNKWINTYTITPLKSVEDIEEYRKLRRRDILLNKMTFPN